MEDKVIVQAFFNAIQKNKLTIEQVPDIYKTEVQKLIDNA